ncbi:hypothetical protein SAMN04487910_1352 [Aquimarina amphilecti]|uniref:Uncharacterized protein n=1 Tax=Aquimarina amphilecti TaxID=1038014 RepID=A0A1H7KK94_AQUAM|nr:hypothetical protein SAMN04487910_1352 [Aquimarina amphilecti]
MSDKSNNEGSKSLIEGNGRFFYAVVYTIRNGDYIVKTNTLKKKCRI